MEENISTYSGLLDPEKYVERAIKVVDAAFRERKKKGSSDRRKMGNRKRRWRSNKKRRRRGSSEDEEGMKLGLLHPDDSREEVKRAIEVYDFIK